MDKTVLRIIREDWENKKSFLAHWQATCFIDKAPIIEGDEIFFYGEKKKCCRHCYDEVLSELSGSGVGIAPSRPLPKYRLPYKSKQESTQEKNVNQMDYAADDMPF